MAGRKTEKSSTPETANIEVWADTARAIELWAAFYMMDPRTPVAAAISDEVRRTGNHFSKEYYPGKQEDFERLLEETGIAPHEEE